MNESRANAGLWLFFFGLGIAIVINQTIGLGISAAMP
jgi:hypothetical protein